MDDFDESLRDVLQLLAVRNSDVEPQPHFSPGAIEYLYEHGYIQPSGSGFRITDHGRSQLRDLQISRARARS